MNVTIGGIGIQRGVQPQAGPADLDKSTHHRQLPGKVCGALLCEPLSRWEQGDPSFHGQMAMPGRRLQLTGRGGRLHQGLPRQVAPALSKSTVSGIAGVRKLPSATPQMAGCLSATAKRRSPSLPNIKRRIKEGVTCSLPVPGRSLRSLPEPIWGLGGGHSIIW